MSEYSVAQCEAQRLEIACLRRDTERLKQELAAARAAMIDAAIMLHAILEGRDEQRGATWTMCEVQLRLDLMTAARAAGGGE